MTTRFLPEETKKQLMEGYLKPVLELAQFDPTIMLCIRDRGFDLYYRGGCIQRIRESNKRHKGTIDKKYVTAIPEILGVTVPHQRDLNDKEEVKDLVQAIPYLKAGMDRHGANKAEREFQQLVARENNSSTISNDTEYFITDIEYSMPGVDLAGGRFDLLGVEWLAGDRSRGMRVRPAIFEMKYGDGALQKDSGMLDHLSKLLEAFKDKDKGLKNSIIRTIEYQFNALKDLSLLKFNLNKQGSKVIFEEDYSGRLPYIFVLANTNPRAKILSNELAKTYTDPQSNIEKCQFLSLVEALSGEGVDVQFFEASFAGYGMHRACMTPAKVFREKILKGE